MVWEDNVVSRAERDTIDVCGNVGWLLQGRRKRKQKNKSKKAKEDKPDLELALEMRR
jgi:hypothetical protein